MHTFLTEYSYSFSTIGAGSLDETDGRFGPGLTRVEFCVGSRVSIGFFTGFLGLERRTKAEADPE